LSEIRTIDAARDSGKTCRRARAVRAFLHDLARLVRRDARVPPAQLMQQARPIGRAALVAPPRSPGGIAS